MVRCTNRSCPKPDTEAICFVVQYKFAQMMRQKMSIYTMMYCNSLIDRQSSLMSTAPIVPKLIMAKVATPKYRLLKIMIDWEYLSLLFVCCFRLCLSFSFSFCSISECLHGFLRRWSCNTAHYNKSSCENCESSVHSIIRHTIYLLVKVFSVKIRRNIVYCIIVYSMLEFTSELHITNECHLSLPFSALVIP